MKILIDNGHGLMTAGKRSPDGLFREAFYNREIARKVVADLLDKNLDAELLVPEDDDISLSERVRRINAHCLALGKKNVSIHLYRYQTDLFFVYIKHNVKNKLNLHSVDLLRGIFICAINTR